jgi:microcystin-dependent protein
MPIPIIKISQGTSVIGPQAPSDVGDIIEYGSATPPAGWLVCNGQAVSRTTYAFLFASIGTTYGAGDGSTTFNVPGANAITPISGGTSHYYDCDDFINSPPKFVTLTATGTGAQNIIYFAATIPDHPGFAWMLPGTSGTGLAQAPTYPIGLSTLPYTWRAVLNVAGTYASHNIYSHFGFANTGGSLASLTSFILFYFNPAVSPNWLYEVATAGVGTSGNTGIAASNVAWVDLKIVATQTLVQFYFNQTLVATVTTNIPASTIPLYPIVVIANNGDTSGAMNINLDLVEIDLATPMTNRFSKCPV